MSNARSEVMRWFPATAYYRNHADRLTYAFTHLPPLAHGFRCLCLGSWGAEVPYLMGRLGASEVSCVRAPGEGVPAIERREIAAPGDLGVFPVTLHALDVEVDPLPESLRGRFDLVLAWEVLEHLCVNPPHLVWQAILAARAGGVLSITTPNALWHYYTTAQVFGQNALGLRLQPHKPFATHWRLYSPAEVADLCTSMGCEVATITSFLNTEPFSLKSRLFLAALGRFRRRSGNGECSYGQFVHVQAVKRTEPALYRPPWLFPDTKATGGDAHLA